MAENKVGEISFKGDEISVRTWQTGELNRFRGLPLVATIYGHKLINTSLMYALKIDHPSQMFRVVTRANRVEFFLWTAEVIEWVERFGGEREKAIAAAVSAF